MLSKNDQKVFFLLIIILLIAAPLYAAEGKITGVEPAASKTDVSAEPNPKDVKNGKEMDRPGSASSSPLTPKAPPKLYFYPPNDAAAANDNTDNYSGVSASSDSQDVSGNLPSGINYAPTPPSDAGNEPLPLAPPQGATYEAWLAKHPEVKERMQKQQELIRAQIEKNRAQTKDPLETSSKSAEK